MRPLQPRAIAWARLLLPLALLLPVGCTGRDPAPRNVILILVDTARADRFSTYGYDRPTTPRIDRLASAGAVFLNHYSQSSHTRAAMPALLYSRVFVKPILPSHASSPFESPEDLFRTVDDEAVSLQRALGAAGLHTVLISTHPWIGRKSELGRQFDEIHELDGNKPEPHTGDLTYPYALADRMVDETIQWLTENGERRFFLHLHLMDPHSPHYFTGEAEKMLDPSIAPPPSPEAPMSLRDGKQPAERELAWLNAAYDGSLNSVDRALGRLFDWLESAGSVNDTLIVLTSDHGELLFERKKRREHNGPMYEPVARVPLILHYPPRVRPARVGALSESIDVMPTILGLLDIELDESRSMDGEDLLRVDPRETADQEVLSATSIRRGRYKLILHTPAEHLVDPHWSGHARGELYDLQVDPSEDTDLWSASPDLVDRLLQHYRVRMEAPYNRFANAITHAQPESPFAISSRDFRFDLPAEQTVEKTLQEAGWRLSTKGRRSSLHGQPGAQPLGIEFPLPNGRYRLSIEGHGPLTVKAGDSGDCAATSGAFEAVPGKAGKHRLGVLDICSESFVALLSPSGPVEVKHFGFEPLRAQEPTRPDVDTTRRLKALGYIN